MSKTGRVNRRRSDDRYVTRKWRDKNKPKRKSYEGAEDLADISLHRIAIDDLADDS